MFDINHVAEHIQLIFHGCKLSMTDEHNVSAILKLSSYEDCRAKISPKMSTFKANKKIIQKKRKKLHLPPFPEVVYLHLFLSVTSLEVQQVAKCNRCTRECDCNSVRGACLVFSLKRVKKGRRLGWVSV